MIISNFRSNFSITSSIGVVSGLLYVLTVMPRMEILGCQERKLSNRGRGISLLVWKDRNLGKVVVFNSIFHKKLVEEASREQTVSSSRSCDTSNRSGQKGAKPKFPSIVRLVRFQAMGVCTGGIRISM